MILVDLRHAEFRPASRSELRFLRPNYKVFEGCAPKCFNSKRSNLDRIVDTAFILPRGDYRDG